MRTLLPLLLLAISPTAFANPANPAICPEAGLQLTEYLASAGQRIVHDGEVLAASCSSSLSSDVAYFRADHKYVAVVTADSEALISLPLKELVARLDGEHFWQVHRSTIVNARAIKSVGRSLSGKLGITLKDRPETLAVSPGYVHRFKQL